jgi:predicted DNA-binding antitoxin AbrB/MazE fold protein
MAQDFQAVYEHGVFRPLSRMNLPDHARVVLTLQGSFQGATVQPVLVDNLLGSAIDEPDLIDQVVDSAMNARETYPLRAEEE